uniref:Mitochondrial ribonuclease P catalytic subunit n=1 Tax=Eptatretus burgeri TaxID=7764 RepID=A0A8C4QUY1_EPTBU
MAFRSLRLFHRLAESKALFVYGMTCCGSAHEPKWAPPWSVRWRFHSNEHGEAADTCGGLADDGTVKQNKRAHGWGKRNQNEQMLKYHGYSPFMAGQAKKRADTCEAMSVDEHETDFEDKTPKTQHPLFQNLPNHPLSPTEWKDLKQKKNFELQVMLFLHKKHIHLDTAKSLLTFVALETQEVPTSLLHIYLRMCLKAGDITETHEAAQLLLERVNYLDFSSCNTLLRVLCTSEEWQLCLPLLEHLRNLVGPRSPSICAVATAALRHGDVKLAWKLYAELIKCGLQPTDELLKAFFSSKELGGKAAVNCRQDMEGLLWSMEAAGMYPSESLARAVAKWFERGICPDCHHKLSHIRLTAEEFEDLRNKTMAKLIQGTDVFNRTTPQELERFDKFVREKGPFTIVIDGLNVGNVSVKTANSKILLDVVTHLASQGHQLLVLGRKHMLRSNNRWQTEDMRKLKKLADCFFTDNISKDDPFLIYACLYSGQACRFITNDLMRDHKAGLCDQHTQLIFFKWQRSHQLMLDYSTKLMPNFHKHDVVIQASEDLWHIPHDANTVQRSTYEVPYHWLCLRKYH